MRQRLDSKASLLWAKATERDRFQALGRSFDFICTWNPRQQDKTAWMAQPQAARAWVEPRPGKRTALLSWNVERAAGKIKRPFRLIVRVTERTLDTHGQYLLLPAIDLEGW